MISVKDLELMLGKREIFSGLNFEIAHGEKVGIIGGEGAGKSTLLDILAKRILPTAGDVKISGEVLSVDGSVYADFSDLRKAEMSSIEKLLAKPARLDEMKRCAKKISRPFAAKDIVNYVKKIGSDI